MRKLHISTSRWKDGYKAWLKDDPKVKATSTVSPIQAATNLATRMFLGHNHFAQLNPADVAKVIVSQNDPNSYLATYDK